MQGAERAHPYGHATSIFPHSARERAAKSIPGRIRGTMGLRYPFGKRRDGETPVAGGAGFAGTRSKRWNPRTIPRKAGTNRGSPPQTCRYGEHLSVVLSSGGSPFWPIR